MTWKKHRAEIFVNIDRLNNVMMITNEIWSKLNEKEYDEEVSKNPQNFTRHKDFDNYLMKIEYGV